MVGAPLGGAAPLGHDDRMAGRRVTLGRETDAPQLGREPLGTPRDVPSVLGLGADAWNREERVQPREAGRLVVGAVGITSCQVDGETGAARARALVDQRGGGHVLQGRAGAVEDDDLVR